MKKSFIIAIIGLISIISIVSAFTLIALKSTLINAFKIIDQNQNLTDEQIANKISFDGINQTTITDFETERWYGFKLTSTNDEEYIAFDKEQGRGDIAFSIDQKLGAFLSPILAANSNNKWWLCPLRNITNFNYGITVENDSKSIWYNSSSTNIACYEYHNWNNKVNSNIKIEAKLKCRYTQGDCIFKANVTSNKTVGGIGFGFLFVPLNQTAFRYALIKDQVYDLASTPVNVPIDSHIQFLDQNQEKINIIFNWQDVLDQYPNANNLSEIIQINDNYKGLLIGIYKTGSFNNINIDPTIHIIGNIKEYGNITYAPFYYETKLKHLLINKKNVQE